MEVGSRLLPGCGAMGQRATLDPGKGTGLLHGAVNGLRVLRWALLAIVPRAIYRATSLPLAELARVLKVALA